MKIQIFDNGGETMGRYTVVYLDRPGFQAHAFYSRIMSGRPFSSDGVDKISSIVPENLGVRVRFRSLPVDCQKRVLNDLGFGNRRLFVEDYGLDERQLSIRYAGSINGHPGFSTAMYRAAVTRGVLVPYWQWVVCQLEQEHDEFSDLVDAGVLDSQDSVQGVGMSAGCSSSQSSACA